MLPLGETSTNTGTHVDSLFPFSLSRVGPGSFQEQRQGAVRYINLPKKNLWIPASCGQLTNS